MGNMKYIFVPLIAVFGLYFVMNTAQEPTEQLVEKDAINTKITYFKDKCDTFESKSDIKSIEKISHINKKPTQILKLREKNNSDIKMSGVKA